MFVQEYNKKLDDVTTTEEFLEISRSLAEGKLMYAFPYQLKEFIIKYANIVLEHLNKANGENI
jgi:hypothetical protein